MTGADIDRKVEAAVRSGVGTFIEIWKAVSPFASDASSGLLAGFDRQVDRSLQRLRKARKIRRAGKPARWVLIEQKTCPTCNGSGKI